MSGQQLAPRAKEMTVEEAEQRREEMFGIQSAIKQAIAEGKAAAWKLAAYLDKFDENVGWSALGYESQNHWLADPEIGLSHSTFHRLVDSYRLLKKHEIEPAVIKQLEVSKIQIALSAVRQGRANLADAIDDAQQLGQRDLRIKYRDPAAGVIDDTGAGAGAGDDPPPKPTQPTGDDPVDAADVTAGLEDGEPTTVPVDDQHQRAREEVDRIDQIEKARHTLEQVDLGLAGVSDAVRLHGLRAAREFIVDVYPEAGDAG